MWERFCDTTGYSRTQTRYMSLVKSCMILDNYIDPAESRYAGSRPAPRKNMGPRGLNFSYNLATTHQKLQCGGYVLSKRQYGETLLTDMTSHVIAAQSDILIIIHMHTFIRSAWDLRFDNTPAATFF